MEKVLTVGGPNPTRPLTDFVMGQNYGNTYYANSAVTASGSGKSWGRAFKTLTEGVAALSAGDTLFCRGSFNEAVTIATAGVKVINISDNPADCVWTAPTVAGSFCAYLNAANIEIYGFKIKPVIYTSSGIPSGIKIGTAPYAKIRKCRFQGQTGSYCAIYAPTASGGVCDNIEIDDNEFIYMNTLTNGYAIYGVAGAGDLNYSAWKITNNRFNSCYNDIVLPCRNSLLEGNKHFIGGVLATGLIGAVTAGKAINLSGAATGGNTVTRNTLGGAYTSSLYVQGLANDNWMGNFAAITATTAPYGLTVAYPAV